MVIYVSDYITETTEVLTISIPKLKVSLGHYSTFFRYKALKNLWNLFKKCF